MEARPSRSARRRRLLLFVVLAEFLLSVCIGIVVQVAASSELPAGLGWLADGERAWWVLSGLLIVGIVVLVVLWADADPPSGPPANASPSQLGRALSRDLDPFDLGVHPVISGPDPDVSLPALTPYVEREHDVRVRSEVAAARAGHSRMLVLVGSSSTGKTRSCWEALGELTDEGNWRLWQPRSPGPAQALLDGLDRHGSGTAPQKPALCPRTVVWLDELQHFLAHPEIGEAVAAGIADLLSDASRGPVLVVGTIWAERWRALTAEPPVTGPDPHAQARRLLDGKGIRVPDSFEADPTAIAAAGAADPRWLTATHEAAHRPTQYLAGGYALLQRLDLAGPAERAILLAAADARRLGHAPGLGLDMLRAAAAGYLEADDITILTSRDEHWFTHAVHELRRPQKGVPGPLAPMTTAVESLELADYLEQQIGLARKGKGPPEAFWTATVAHGDPASLVALATAAEGFDEFEQAWALYFRALRNGHGSSHDLFRQAERRAWSDGPAAAEEWMRTAAEHGDASAMYWLAENADRHGEHVAGLAWTQSAAAAGLSLAPAWLAAGRLARGDALGALDALANAPADHPFTLWYCAQAHLALDQRQAADDATRGSAMAGHVMAVDAVAEDLRASGDTASARPFLLERFREGHVYAVRLLADMHLRDGDVRAAEEVLAAVAGPAQGRGSPRLTPPSLARRWPPQETTRLILAEEPDVGGALS